MHGKFAVICIGLIAIASTVFARGDALQPDESKICSIDRTLQMLTLLHDKQLQTVRVRSDAVIMINGVSATFDQLTTSMIAKVTLAEPGVAQKIDATGALPEATPASTLPSPQVSGASTPIAPSDSSAVSPDDSTPAALAKRLAGTTWAEPDGNKKKWIHFNEDMTIKTGWFRELRPWKVTDGHTIDSVAPSNSQHWTLTFNADFSEAVSPTGAIFRRIR